MIATMIGPLRRALLAPAFAVLWALGAASGQAAEVIHSFDSDVQVARDGDLTVTETIRVRAEGRQIRRGIFRDFPLTFTDAEGRLREVTFELLDVTRDGRPEPHFTERRGRVLRIYAGDKDVLIQRGDHTYVFRYRTGRQIRWFDGKPELNWNVTGNFWDFTIEKASYRLHLVDGLRPVRWTAFTGLLGARGTDWRGAIGDDGVLSVVTTRPLPSREGLTVVAALPAGAVEPPSEAQLFWYAVSDNRHWIFGGLGFVLVLGYYLAAWSSVGRDPKGGTIIPLFHPPRDISPALANYVENWGFGRNKWRAFTAAALSLAVRGLIRFDENDGTLTLKSTGRQAQATGTLPPGERAVLTFVNASGGTAKIDRSNGSLVATAGSTFTSAIEDENRHRFFRRNLGYVVAGVIMTVAVIVGLILSGALREEDTIVIIAVAFGSFWLGMFLVPIVMTLFRASSFSSVVRALMTVAVLAIFISIASSMVQSAFPNGIGDVLPLLGSIIADYPFPIALVGGFAALNGLFVYLMRAPTALGRPIMDQLAGFKLYLETAESDRLNMQAPEITTERFETLLPYAVALHAEKPWSEAFESALRRAHPGEAAPMQHYRPAWHSGSWSTGSFSGAAMAATVAGASSALASAVPVSSGSSGFSGGGGGGGGGSGGGGGGGGGGGW